MGKLTFFNRYALPPPLCAGYEHNSKQPQMTRCVVAARQYASLPKPSTSLTTISSSFRSTPLPLRPFWDSVAFTLTSEAATWATWHRLSVYTEIPRAVQTRLLYANGFFGSFQFYRKPPLPHPIGLINYRFCIVFVHTVLSYDPLPKLNHKSYIYRY